MELLLLVPVLVLGGVVLVLGGVVWYILRSQATERNDYLRVIAELTEKIQHPEIPHPVAPVLGPSGRPPPEPDDIGLVGQILPQPPEDLNGGG